MTTPAEPRDGRTLLIVDDDDRFRARLMQAFRERGFEVRGAADYEEAMTSAAAESPELALVDLRLPGGSGLDLVQELKQLDATTNVVVLTGYGSIATALESVRAGATTYWMPHIEMIASHGSGDAQRPTTRHPPPIAPAQAGEVSCAGGVT